MPYSPTPIIQAFAAHNGKRNAPDVYALGANGLLYQLQWTKDGTDSWLPEWHELPALPETYAATTLPIEGAWRGKKSDTSADDDIPF